MSVQRAAAVLPSAAEIEPVGIRETLNQSPAATTGITVGVIVVVLVVIFLQTRDRDDTPPGVGKAFYSTSESAADIFIDDFANDPPFDHRGKPAYRVIQFTCDDGRSKFVGYLERYTPAGLAMIAAARKRGVEGYADLERAEESEREIKAPDGPWMRANDPRAAAILQPLCPDGSPPRIAMPGE